MDLMEFIGFIITLMAFIILVLRRSYERWKKKKFPDLEEDSGDQGNQLEDFLKSLEDDMEETKKPVVTQPAPTPILKHPPKKPPTPPSASKPLKPVGALNSHIEHRTFDSQVEKRKLETKIEDRFTGKTVVSKHFQDLSESDPYQIRKEMKHEARGRSLIQQMKSRRDMIVISEIIRKPKSLCAYDKL